MVIIVIIIITITISVWCNVMYIFLQVLIEQGSDCAVIIWTCQLKHPESSPPLDLFVCSLLLSVFLFKLQQFRYLLCWFTSGVIQVTINNSLLYGQGCHGLRQLLSPRNKVKCRSEVKMRNLKPSELLLWSRTRCRRDDGALMEPGWRVCHSIRLTQCQYWLFEKGVMLHKQ